MNLLLSMRNPAIQNKYDCSFTPDLKAAQALSLLNHVAKYSHRERDTIYFHKRIAILDWAERGHVQSCYQVLQKLDCWACFGTGTWRADFSNYSEMCYRCDGTGVYRQFPIVQITLAIHGKLFVWHQPDVELYAPFFTDKEVAGVYENRASHYQVIPQWDVDEAQLLVLHHLKSRGLRHGNPFAHRKLSFKRIFQQSYEKSLWQIRRKGQWFAEKLKPSYASDEDSPF